MTNKYDTTLLAKIIEQLCDEHHIAVKEMLIRSGLNRNVVDNLKKGSIPSVDKIAQIADYFDCSVDYLLGRSDNSQSYSNNNISNNTNIAFGEHSSVKTSNNNDSITKETNKIVEKVIIKKYDYSNGDNITCPFCDANVSKIIGNTVVEIIVSPTECYQLLPKPFTPVNPVDIDYLNPKHTYIGTSTDTKNVVTNELKVQFVKCPYCSKTSYKVFSYDKNCWTNIYPNSCTKQFNNAVPNDVYKDYSEACAILSASPSASATLSRRCLQKMIRQRWNIELRTLENEIDKIPISNISQLERDALHAIRQIGNIGAHPDKILEVEPEDAELTIKIIEIFFQKWYVDEPAEQDLLSKAIKNNNEKQNRKKISP